MSDTLATAIVFLVVVLAIAGIGVAVGMLVARWLDGRVAADDEGSSDDGTDRRPGE
jgi:hypothetical protein